MTQDERPANIKALTLELEKIYLTEAIYGSKCSLWKMALEDYLIDKAIFEQARAYYGKLWNYRGD